MTKSREFARNINRELAELEELFVEASTSTSSRKGRRVSAAKAYKADWLDNVKEVYRDASGQFTSKKSSVASAPGGEGDEGDEGGEGDEASLGEKFSNFLEDTWEPKEFKDAAKKSRDNFEKNATDEQKAAAKKNTEKIVKDATSQREAKKISKDLKDSGLISDDEEGNFLEGAKSAGKKLLEAAGNGISAAIEECMKFLKKMKKAIFGDKDDPKESEDLVKDPDAEEPETQKIKAKNIGEGAIAANAATSMIGIAGGLGAAIPVVASITGSGSNLKKGLLQGALGVGGAALGTEAGARGGEALVSALPEDHPHTEQVKAYSAALGGIAGSLIGSKGFAMAKSGSAKAKKAKQKGSEIIDKAKQKRVAREKVKRKKRQERQAKKAKEAAQKANDKAIKRFRAQLKKVKKDGIDLPKDIGSPDLPKDIDSPGGVIGWLKGAKSKMPKLPDLSGKLPNIPKLDDIAMEAFMI